MSRSLPSIWEQLLLRGPVAEQHRSYLRMFGQAAPILDDRRARYADEQRRVAQLTVDKSVSEGVLRLLPTSSRQECAPACQWPGASGGWCRTPPHLLATGFLGSPCGCVADNGLKDLGNGPARVDFD